MKKLVLALVLAALGLGAGDPRAEPPGKDLDAERAGLLERDKDWSRSTGDREKLLSFWSKDAYFLVPGMPMIRGLEAITKVEDQLFAAPGTSLSWKPLASHVSAAADLGHTIGTYELTTTDAQGKKTVSVGKYLTVWARKAGGDWMVIADIFNSDEPPAGTEP